jgi:nitrate/nitrite-specific signal transduction histidine kinase
MAQTTIEAIDYKNAINLSGKQRMLTQKMAKAFVLQVKDIQDQKVQNELNFSKVIFEQQLAMLKKHPTHPVTQPHLDKVDQLWGSFKAILEQPVSNEGAVGLMLANTALLKACDAVVTKIKDDVTPKGAIDKNLEALAGTINRAGKQRMLSQRMCLYFTALKNYPEHKAEYESTLQSVFEQFTTAIKLLAASKFNTPEIKAELDAIVGIWKDYETNKSSFLNSSYEVPQVYALTNDLTKRFDKITVLYELSASEKQ